ncbi:MAG: hypothetical protein H6732_02475 [Alphaproteobacteria bacterium]|nr:hypothetical protein [Alphaproteobacteria bacterium]
MTRSLGFAGLALGGLVSCVPGPVCGDASFAWDVREVRFAEAEDALAHHLGDLRPEARCVRRVEGVDRIEQGGVEAYGSYDPRDGVVRLSAVTSASLAPSVLAHEACHGSAEGLGLVVDHAEVFAPQAGDEQSDPDEVFAVLCEEGIPRMAWRGALAEACGDARLAARAALVSTLGAEATTLALHATTLGEQGVWQPPTGWVLPPDGVLGSTRDGIVVTLLSERGTEAPRTVVVDLATGAGRALRDEDVVEEAPPAARPDPDLGDEVRVSWSTAVAGLGIDLHAVVVPALTRGVAQGRLGVLWVLVRPDASVEVLEACIEPAAAHAALRIGGAVHLLAVTPDRLTWRIAGIDDLLP